MTWAPQSGGDTGPVMKGHFNDAYDDTNEGAIQIQDDGLDLPAFSSQYGSTNTVTQTSRDKIDPGATDEQER